MDNLWHDCNLEYIFRNFFNSINESIDRIGKAAIRLILPDGRHVRASYYMWTCVIALRLVFFNLRFGPTCNVKRRVIAVSSDMLSAERRTRGTMWGVLISARRMARLSVEVCNDSYIYTSITYVCIGDGAYPYRIG